MKSLGAVLSALAVLLAASPVPAESAGPYAGWQARDIKALSAAEIDDLREGRGMGLALAAELNGYPGPRHVLDLGGDLGLTLTQRRTFEALFLEMQAEAQRLGAAILAQEAALERNFRSGAISAAALRAALAALATLQGELRYTHLRYHLAAKALLDPHQIARYAALRGYGAAEGHSGHGQGRGSQGH